MADVIKKAIESQDINNGSASVFVNELQGSIDVLSTTQAEISVSAVESRYTNRLEPDVATSIALRPIDSGTVPITITAGANQAANLLSINNPNGTPYLHVDASGFLYLDRPVWDDLRIVPSAFDFAGNSDPALTSWQPGGAGAPAYRVWEFGPADEAFFSAQLPHAYATGSDVKVHVHWTAGSRGVAESGKTVAWKLEASWANINGVFASGIRYDLTSTCDGINDKQLMSADVVMSGVGKSISSTIMCRLLRDTGDTWATNTATNCPILLEVDFHYPINTLGSRYSGAK